MIPNRCGYALLRSVIGPQNYRHFLNQSEAKLKSFTPWSLAFSRTLHSLPSHWLLFFFFCLFLIGCSGKFGKCLRYSIERALFNQFSSNDFWFNDNPQASAFLETRNLSFIDLPFFFSLNFSMKLR